MKGLFVYAIALFLLTHSAASPIIAVNFPDTFQEEGKDKKKDGKKKDGKKDSAKKDSKKEVNKETKKAIKHYSSISTIITNNSWSLPAELKEISGITFISEGLVACIQDETGTIFQYDLSSKKIIKTIPFAGAGDYEGIAYVKGFYYVITSEGRLFQIDPFKPRDFRLFDTGLTVQNNCEGLTYDQKNERLLIAIKAQDPQEALKKGIYAFDLKTMKPVKDAVAFIDLENEKLKDPTKKNDNPLRRTHPSDLAIDKQGNILIVNGVNSTLMILRSDGTISDIINLDRKLFPQPEGITYSPSGKLYISSEGATGSGIIAECTVVPK